MLCNLSIDVIVEVAIEIATLKDGWRNPGAVGYGRGEERGGEGGQIGV